MYTCTINSYQSATVSVHISDRLIITMFYDCIFSLQKLYNLVSYDLFDVIDSIINIHLHVFTCKLV